MLEIVPLQAMLSSRVARARATTQKIESCRYLMSLLTEFTRTLSLGSVTASTTPLFVQDGMSHANICNLIKSLVEVLPKRPEVIREATQLVAVLL